MQPGVHHGQAVAHGERLLLIVRDVHERDAHLAVQRAQLHLQHSAQLGVERAQRLVEQQHLRAQHQRAGQRDALLLATRELVRLARLVPVEPHQLQRLGDAALGLGLRAVEEAQTERNVVRNRLVREQRVALEHGVDRPLLGRHTAHVGAVDAHRAVLDLLEAADQSQGGGLAATGRAEQREELTRLDHQIDGVEHLLVAVPLRQRLELDATTAA